jgi:hypothetical protein
MTEIKYKDTSIPVEAGQTVTLNTADKKLTGDIEVTAPKESGGGDTRDVRTLCVNLTGGYTATISYCLENAPTTGKEGLNGFKLWWNFSKGTRLRLKIVMSYQSYFKSVYCEQLGGEISTTVAGDVRYTDWFVINDNIFDFNIAYNSMPSGGGN